MLVSEAIPMHVPEITASDPVAPYRSVKGVRQSDRQTDRQKVLFQMTLNFFEYGVGRC